MDLKSNSIKSSFMKYKRVWHVLKKPTREEFELIVKVSAIGVLVIGAAGFLISLFVNMMPFE